MFDQNLIKEISKIPDFIESYKTAEEKIKVENKVKQLLRKCLTIDEKVVQKTD